MGRVVVAGGGTAGFAAALGAAKAGGTVTVLEQLSYLGGTMTGGLVPGIVSMRHQPWRDQETLVQMESSYAGPQVVRGVAHSVGVRETRRIVGDYMLTGTDVLNAQTFDDAVGYCGATVDVHDVEGGKEKTRMSAIREGKAYQVPFGVTLPKGLDALLVAGRCVSADRVACGSIRQQAGCIVTGQAAGAAAAMSSQRNSLPRDIAVGDLQQELRRQGVVLDRLPTDGAPA